jgi:hypothetical protein
MGEHNARKKREASAPSDTALLESSPENSRPLVPLESRPLVPLESRPLVPLESRPLVPLESRSLVPLESGPLVPLESRPLEPTSAGSPISSVFNQGVLSNTGGMSGRVKLSLQCRFNFYASSGDCLKKNKIYYLLAYILLSS